MSTMDPKEKFYRQFQNSVVTIQDQISQLPSFAAVGGERQDAVEHILSGISRLSLQVADAAEFVPAYDQRTYSDVVKALTDQVNEATARLAPKNRFQFKKRAANGPAAAAARPDTRRLNPAPAATPAAGGGGDDGAVASSSKSAGADAKDTAVGILPSTTTSRNYNAEIARPPGGGGSGGGGIRRPSFSAARDIALSDHARVHIALPASAARATAAGTLTSLARCMVDMTAATAGDAPFASLALKDIEGSVVVAGRVAGPVHVTGVRESVVVVAARQVRIHECRDVVFYLHCGSRPIIEDCKGVRFARAPGFLLTDKEKSETNMFDQVDDFKWLKSAASPNWSLLPESEAIPDEVWEKALASGPDVAIDDTLRELGVGKGT